MDKRLQRLIERHRLCLALGKLTLFCLRWGRNLMWRVFLWQATRRYLESHQIRKLQVGAGPNLLDGWLNTDKHPAATGV